MHVAPVDLRAVRQDGIRIRFAMLGADGVHPCRGARTPDRRHIPRASVPAPIGAWSSTARCVRIRSTPADHPCRSRVPRAGRRQGAPVRDQRVDSCSPRSSRSMRELDVSEARLVEQGFEIVSDGVEPPTSSRRVSSRRQSSPARSIVETWRDVSVRDVPGPDGRNGAATRRAGATLRIGGSSPRAASPSNGSTTSRSCRKGDIFHCPAGPPGHRIEAADPATFIDLTPISAFAADLRLTDWRRALTVEPVASGRGIAVAALG